jgi:hypothetical protein
MARIQRVELKRFDGGHSDDVRTPSNNQYERVLNFDVFSNPSKLTPYRKKENDMTVNGTSSTMTEFHVKHFINNGTSLIGLGIVDSGLGGRLRVLEKTSLPAGDWTLSGTGTQTDAGTAYQTSGLIYKDYIYALRTSANNNKGRLFKYGALSTGVRVMDLRFGTDPFNIDDTTLSRTGRSSVGIDDRAYFPYENKLGSTDGSTVTDADISVPTDYNIKSTTAWRKFMAMGCTKTDNTNSRIYLWDYVSDDVSEVIDLGAGKLIAFGNVDDTLVAVMDSSRASLVLKPVVRVKIWSGGMVRTIKELPLFDADGNTYTVNEGEEVESGKLFFTIYDSTGTDLAGIYVVTKNKRGRWAVAIDQAINNTATVASFSAMKKMSDYWWVSHGANGTIDRTDNGANYTNSDVVMQKFGDPHKVHTLLAVGVSHVALGSGEAVEVQYRVNENTAWTTIFTSQDDNALSKMATLEVDQAKNFSDFSEAQIRAISTGGAEITGLRAKFVEQDNDL